MDTLGFVYVHENQPMEVFYFLKDGECYLQTLNLYCSICADKMVEDILKDKRYKFKVHDVKNYISTKKKYRPSAFSKP